MKNVKLIVTSSCVALALVGGCGGAPETSGSLPAGSTPTQTESSEVRTEAPEARILIASIAKSDTHTIQFWEHEQGVTQVLEDLDVDRDLVPGRVTLMNTDIRGKTLVEAYGLLVADGKPDPLAVEKLASVDARLGALTTLVAGGAPAAENSAASGYIPPAADLVSGPGRVTQALASSCGQLNWPAEVAWFKNSFCGNDSRVCFANANYSWVSASASYTNQNSWFRATGMAESSCDWAFLNFSVTVKACNLGITRYPDSQFLGPRQLYTENWSTSGCTLQADWWVKVTGNAQPQDLQYRLGLAVHEQ